jgi:lipopolysaccharide biosynthesis glycosyltransferase
MMTLASIIDSQKLETKLRFHFAVVLSFNVEHMLKIYSLRGRIRDDVEFNFYNAKKSETDLKNVNTKGPGAVAKLLLPNLLPKDVERLIVLDTGDLLVLRDLSVMYNWKMDNYLCLGIPGCRIGKYAKISKKKYLRYINTGSILINVKKYRHENIYEKCVKNKGEYHSDIGDQDLLNDILFGKVGYLPMKFGLRAPYYNDNKSDIVLEDNPYIFYTRSYSKVNYTFNPQKINKFIQLGYNPIVIHQFNGKWMYGKGMTIYRRLAQYYIRMAGIWNEICIEFSGYCQKY